MCTWNVLFEVGYTLVQFYWVEVLEWISNWASCPWASSFGLAVSFTILQEEIVNFNIFLDWICFNTILENVWQSGTCRTIILDGEIPHVWELTRKRVGWHQCKSALHHDRRHIIEISCRAINNYAWIWYWGENFIRDCFISRVIKPARFR